MTKRIGVVVVDDRAVVRAGVAALLDREPDIDVLAVADSADGADAAVAAAGPDVAVVGQVAGTIATALCQRLLESDPRLAVVVLGAGREQDAEGSQPAGVQGWVDQDVVARDLTTVVRAAAAEAGRPARPRRRRADLSPRELEVLRLVAKGATDKQIGATLGLSDNTVRTYLRRILAKLGCRGRSEAAAVAAQRGLL